MTDLRQAYATILPLVEQPARYTGGERGTVVKDLAQVRLRFALALRRLVGLRLIARLRRLFRRGRFRFGWRLLDELRGGRRRGARGLGAGADFAFLEQLEEGGAAGVAEAALVPFNDSSVPARTVFEAGTDLFEEAGNRFAIGQPHQRQTPGMKIASLGERNEFLDKGTNFLGLLDRGDDPAVLEKRLGEIAFQGQAMRRV